MTAPQPSPEVRQSKAPVVIGTAVVVAAAAGGVWYYLQHTAVRSADAYLREVLTPQLAAKGATLTYTEVKSAGANSIQVVDARLAGTAQNGDAYEFSTPAVILAAEGRKDVVVSLPGPITSRNKEGTSTITFPTPLEIDLKTDGSPAARVEKSKVTLPDYMEVQEAEERVRITYDAGPAITWEAENPDERKADVAFKNLAVTGEGKALPYVRMDELKLNFKEKQKEQNLRLFETEFRLEKLIAAGEKASGEPIAALNADNPVSIEAEMEAETSVTAEQAAQGNPGQLKKVELKDFAFDYGPKTMLHVKGVAETDAAEPMPYGKFTLTVGGYHEVMNTIATLGLVQGEDMTVFRMVSDKLASYGEMKGEDLELVIAREKGAGATIGRVPLEQAMQEVMMTMMGGGQGLGAMPPVEQRELGEPAE